MSTTGFEKEPPFAGHWTYCAFHLSLNSSAKVKIRQNFQFLFCKFLRKNISSFQRSVKWFSFNTLLIKKGMKLFLYLLIYIDCKTVGFFLKISKEIGKAWRKSLTRAKLASLTRPYFKRLSPVSLSVFSLVPDLLFDCSRVLEYAKIRTVLQSIIYTERQIVL